MSNHETVSKALARPNVFDFVFLMLKLIGPRTAIPMHYATFPVLTGTPEAFGEELKKARPENRAARNERRRNDHCLNVPQQKD